LPSDASSWGKLKPILMKYLNVTKDCGYGTDSTACNTYSNNIYKTYNNKASMRLTYFDDGQFVLQDGSLILLENNNSNTMYISVDVNGYKKKPNRLGKDLFMFQITNNGDLLPMGAKGTDYYSATDDYCSNTSTSNMNGASCTAKVLRN
jgi:hypothetical protein